ncbi:predicted protein, partial [Postia placenta Mad-698-R]
MPKAKPFIVTAKHEPTGLLERIAIHNTHKFDDVGKPRRIVRPTIKPLIRRPFNPERAEKAKHDIEELALRAHLFKKQQLLDRISDPAPPLIDRIDMQAGPSYEYEPPKPLPDIHFQRTKILLRTSEYNEMFAATADRLEPVFARMEKEEGSLELEVVAKVRRMGDGFDELYHGLEKKARRPRNIFRIRRTIGPLDAARPSARFAPSHTEVAGLSRLGIEPRGMPSRRLPVQTSNSNSTPPAPTIPSTITTSSSSPAPTTTTNMSQNTNAPLMPPRGHSTAPTFDPSEVRSLRRYFQDLEALFTRCQITDEAAKKQWAVRYPSIDVADLWETIESFIDVAKSYNDWKADVRALYPGADDTRKWSLADMDQLIGERARIGIHNTADLGCYYRDFMAITKHLIAQHRLSTIEQSRAFLRGFQPALLTRLETRLHLKHPDHYADDPYTMAEIHAAATFILHGTSSTPTTAANQATASTSNTSTTVPPGMIKTEDISMIIESLSRTIATLIQPTTHATHNHAPAPRQQAAVHIHENSGVEQTCHYCGNRGCRVGTCEFAEIDIRDGKCKRNTEGKIVLPNGSFCPRTIPEFTVARDSNAIRSIIALVDNKEQIECIVDPGSQIVAMSEEVCLGLNLLFDPTIQLNMQSANGEVDRSLGLIRNVPFRIGEIVLYLQAHVIRNAAYDILLGRPFDVLTQSVVKNFADENQTITILCPNTGETVTIPT